MVRKRRSGLVAAAGSAILMGAGKTELPPERSPHGMNEDRLRPEAAPWTLRWLAVLFGVTAAIALLPDTPRQGFGYEQPGMTLLLAGAWYRYLLPGAVLYLVIAWRLCKAPATSRTRLALFLAGPTVGAVALPLAGLAGDWQTFTRTTLIVVVFGVAMAVFGPHEPGSG